MRLPKKSWGSCVDRDRHGRREVIALDGYNLLVEPTDPDDLAEKILVALGREWGREAFLQYAERCTCESIVKEILNVYTEVSSLRVEPV